MTIMDKENKDTNLPSQGNRNLADMAQEENLLACELGCIRETAIKDTELIKYIGERIIETLARIGKVEKQLWEMHVFLAREAAFGHNFK